jgi:serine/threonine protein kinase
MHQMQPPLAHRDIKPHNVLIRRHNPAAEVSSSIKAQRDEAASASAPEALPLRSADAAASSRYHAVLMVHLMHPAASRACSYG